MKKKILIVLNNLNIGGVQIFATNIVKNSDLSIFHYDFAVSGSDVGLLENEMESIGCKIIHLPNILKSHRAYKKELKRILSKGQYDVIHCNMNFLSIIPLSCAPKKMIRICHSHASYPASSFRSKIFRLFFRATIRLYADYLLGCSRKSCDWLYGKNKGIVIYNGIDISKFRFNEKDRNDVRSGLGYTQNDYVCINVGSLTKNKRQDFLVDVFKNLEKDHPNFKLLLVGDGPEKERIQEEIKRSGIKNISMILKTDCVYKYLSASDLFLFPSLSEGFPIALLEAVSNGLKCLVSDSVSIEKMPYQLIEFAKITDDNRYFTNKILKRERRPNYELDLATFELSNVIKQITHFYSFKP